MEKSIKSSAINYGLYLGGALSLITIAIWFVDINLMANMWLGIFLLLAIIAFGVVSTAKSKSLNGGFLSFKEAFSSYFITVAIGIGISSIVSMILFNYIDPEAAKQIQQLTVESTINMMEGFGAPAEAIAEAVEKIESQNQFSIVNTLKSLAWGFLFQAIIGLIVALIMKKSDPDA
ncbi:DUF4199 domain-containing protein [Flavobacteriaceae bacterium S0825]|uniref:DUF4199 domain-containing protein n=1 Tax=Gaetbulibacter sp. S0825 TaxID=2720084 RepID=UPI0014308227|nr:DUF4199 domain-containing protein [Gaetbulibacter sp. S0825]MCK0109310.1 DUF4199 domain-containing protein [Flavobacteriaceae bacterium S0825]NIX64944.1 DUF4199 domain-containing protein [Gaetbulibacter sp. S0825]